MVESIYTESRLVRDLLYVNAVGDPCRTRIDMEEGKTVSVSNMVNIAQPEGTTQDRKWDGKANGNGKTDSHNVGSRFIREHNLPS